MNKRACPEIVLYGDECPWCEGSGKETIEFGMWEIDCSNCDGLGYVPDDYDNYDDLYEEDLLDERDRKQWFEDTSDNCPDLTSDNGDYPK